MGTIKSGCDNRKFQTESKLINRKYSYFIKRISDTKIYNLDKESLFMEFNEEVLDA